MTDQRRVPCGIAIPQAFVDEPVDMSLIGRFCEGAESLGYESLWVQEQFIGKTNSLEPINLLSYVSALTTRIRLGTAVIVVTTRNPVRLAKSFGTLDHLSNGRLIAGVALGGRPSQYPLLGAPAERRVRHFIESLEVIKALWEQPTVTYDGEFWKLDGESMEPKPVQKPHPPIWFGGRNPDGLRRAVRYGNGWMGAGSSTTEQFKEHARTIRESLDSSGRDPSSFDVSKRVYVAIDDDEARAERRLREWFGQHYGNADLGSAVSIWGSVSKCVDGLMEVVAGGGEMLLLNQVFDHMEHLERLSSEVIPRLTPR